MITIANQKDLLWELRQMLRDMEQIVVTEGCDQGVILLSQDAPTVYDAEAKCQRYTHENFSPLGNALVLLHRKLYALEEEFSRHKWV